MALNNDFPANAYPITIGSTGQYISGPTDLSTFTKDGSDPDAGSTYPQKTGWFVYRPTIDGTASFALSGVLAGNVATNSPVKLLIVYFSDAQLTSSTTFGAADNNADATTAATISGFSVYAGNTYYVRVSPYQDANILAYLKVLGPPTAAPANDLIAGATPVAITTSGTTWTSAPVPDDQLTVSAEEPYQAGFRSAWYSLLPTGPGNGNFTITASAFAGVGVANTNVVMRIYYGNSPPSLNYLSQATMGSPVSLTLDNSVTIWFEIVQTTAGSDRFSYQLAVTGPSTQVPTPDSTNHQYTRALALPTTGVYSASLDTSNTHFTDTEVNPTTYSLGGNRSAWYTINPTTTGSYTFTVTASGTSVEVDLFNASFTALAGSASNVASVSRTLMAGNLYYYRVAELNSNGPQTYVVTMASDFDTTNHQYANATLISGHGNYSTTLDTTPAHFGDTESNPTPYGLGGYRAGWYSFTPDTTNVYTITATPDTYNVEIDLIRQDTSALVAAVTGYPASLGQQLTGGIAYWLRIATTSNAAQHIALSLTSPATPLAAPPITAHVRLAATANPPRLKAPPIAAAVRVAAHIAGEFSTAAAPAITAHVAMPNASDVIDDDAAPPISAGVTVAGTPVGAGLYLTQPEQGEIIATATPQFIVAVDQHDDDLTYTVEIQYDESSDFSSPYTLSGDVDSSDGGLDITATQALTGSTGYWRARLLLAGVELITWTAANTFTIDATVSAQSLPVTWTVDANAARPIHLWHFDPPGPAVGELVTAYGQGFPSSGNLTFADGPLPYQSWQLIAASTAMSSEARTIDGDVVDPEHYEVTFTAPEVGDEPGGAFVVEA